MNIWNCSKNTGARRTLHVKAHYTFILQPDRRARGRLKARSCWTSKEQHELSQRAVESLLLLLLIRLLHNLSCVYSRKDPGLSTAETLFHEGDSRHKPAIENHARDKAVIVAHHRAGQFISKIMVKCSYIINNCHLYAQIITIHSNKQYCYLCVF